MAVLKHHRRISYTVVDNAAVRDADLSWKATGLLVYLLGMPDGWRVNLTDLTNRKSDGRTAVESGLAELESAGYVVRRRIRDSRGRLRTQIDVAESPELLTEALEQPTLPIAGFPESDNQQKTPAENAGFTTAGFPESDKPTTEKPTVGKPATNKETEGSTTSDLLPSVVDHLPGRRRDPIWDTLLEFPHAFPEPTNDAARSKRNQAVKLLRQSGATPDQIRARVAAWPLHFPDATLTDTALAKHWDRLGHPPAKAPKADVQHLEDELRRQRRARRAAELDAKRKGLGA